MARPIIPAEGTHGVEELTDVLVLVEHVTGLVQKYIDGGGKSAGIIIGLILGDAMAAAPKIQAAIQDADKIRDEIQDMSLSEFGALSRLYLDPILHPLVVGLLMRASDAIRSRKDGEDNQG